MNEKRGFPGSRLAKRLLMGGVLAGTPDLVQDGSLVPDASAAAPTEEAGPVEHERTAHQATFDQIKSSYSTFDDTNLDATRQQLRLYEANEQIVRDLPVVDQAEFWREYAYTRYTSVALLYDAVHGDITVERVALRNAQQEADVQNLQLARKDLATALALEQNVQTLGGEAAQARQDFLRKVGELQPQIALALDCLQGGTPDAVAAKQVTLDRVQAAIEKEFKAEFSTIQFNLDTPLESGTVRVDIKMLSGEQWIGAGFQLRYHTDSRKVEIIPDPMSTAERSMKVRDILKVVQQEQK